MADIDYDKCDGRTFTVELLAGVVTPILAENFRRRAILITNNDTANDADINFGSAPEYAHKVLQNSSMPMFPTGLCPKGYVQGFSTGGAILAITEIVEQ